MQSFNQMTRAWERELVGIIELSGPEAALARANLALSRLETRKHMRLWSDSAEVRKSNSMAMAVWRRLRARLTLSLKSGKLSRAGAWENAPARGRQRQSCLQLPLRAPGLDSPAKVM